MNESEINVAEETPVFVATPDAHEGLRDELTELLDVVGAGKVGDVVLDKAFEVGATDLHFDPTPTGLRIRMRVDGKLHDIVRLPMSAAAPLISRFKVLAGMDIAERRLAQDGHISHFTKNMSRDVRLGSGPTIYGERLILRLFPDPKQFSQLDDLGLEAEDASAVRRCLASPYGLILVAGPVGCGKTTSVYSFLNELNDPHKSIVSIEDPVEQRIDGVCQLQVDLRIGFDFAAAVRCVMRQDPDIMLVGEIRDAETAQVACQAALTGVLVLSTVHASNTASAIEVMRGFGVPTVMLADCLRGIISQRLVLQVCPQSREYYTPDEVTCRVLNIDPQEAGSVQLARGIPADTNFHTGYHGRVGIFEVMEMSRVVQEAILREVPVSQLEEIAEQAGMSTLAKSVRRKVLAGVTSMDEYHATALTLPPGTR
jgi:type II secretory ATPase GspE/PulE/Tfp pilus assembly ATPase PilB-like protein